MIDKRCRTVEEALAGIVSGSSVMVGGFGEVGVPLRLVEGMIEKGVTNLTVIANNAGTGDRGLAALIREGRIRRIVCSYPRSPGSVWFEKAYQAAQIELELVPQGTLTERIRAGGAGIPAFYTATAVGTELARGREIRQFGDRRYLLEHALTADVALVRARQADRWGNLRFHATARNFGPTMAAAAALTIVEADEVVELGGIGPEDVVAPGVYVQRVLVPRPEESEDDRTATQ